MDGTEFVLNANDKSNQAEDTLRIESKENTRRTLDLIRNTSSFNSTKRNQSNDSPVLEKRDGPGLYKMEHPNFHSQST